MQRRSLAAALVAACLLTACQGGAPSALPLASSAAHPPTHGKKKPHVINQNECNPLPGQTEGTITEYTIPGSNNGPAGVAVDGSGNVWVTDFTSSKISEYSPGSSTWASNISTHTSNAEPMEITIDSNNTPWFTEFAGDRASYISGGTAHDVSGSFSAFGIAMNTDGTVYATDRLGFAIEKVTTSGITSIGSTSYYPYEISGDSAGDLWYTGDYNNKIVEVSPAHTYTALTASSQPYDLAEGPAGTGMWFTELAAGKIGNVDLSGTLHEYSIPTSGSQPVGIVNGCGKLWFTEWAKDKVGSIDPVSHTITEYGLASGTAPYGATVDANGNVWFTERNANKIAMIATRTSASPAPDGSLYVLDGATVNGNNGLIVNFAPGNYTGPPTKTITGLPDAVSGLNGHMTFDASGDLWVAYNTAPGTNYITEYAPGASGAATPITTIVPSNTTTAFTGIAIDSSGNPWVSDESGSILEYPYSGSGSTPPGATLAGSSTLLSGVGKIGFDASGNLWAATAAGLQDFSASSLPADGSNNSVNVASTKTFYSSGPYGTATSCTGSFDTINSFAFDPSGNVIVALNVTSTSSAADILKYPTSALGSACPTVGSSEVQNTLGVYGGQPIDISVDDDGYLYTLFSNNTIFATSLTNVFSGAVVPTPYAWLQNSNTQLNGPTAIAIWTNTGWYYGNARHHKGKNVRI